MCLQSRTRISIWVTLDIRKVRLWCIQVGNKAFSQLLVVGLFIFDEQKTNSSRTLVFLWNLKGPLRHSSWNITWPLTIEWRIRVIHKLSSSHHDLSLQSSATRILEFETSTLRGANATSRCYHRCYNIPFFELGSYFHIDLWTMFPANSTVWYYNWRRNSSMYHSMSLDNKVTSRCNKNWNMAIKWMWSHDHSFIHAYTHQGTNRKRL